MSTWREQRRADKLADAEAQAVLLRTRADAQREHEVEQASQRRQDRAARQERRDARRQVWVARGSALRVWLAAHAAELLVYQVALVSGAMAVPAMAAWGVATYGTLTGALLPAITELGMWAFALAVATRRRRDPASPVQTLQFGVGAFASVAAVTNFLHGLDRSGVIAGTVMAIVSVAGVVAHQLITATRPRSRAQRQRHRRTRRFERAALAASVGRVDATGAAELVVPAGTYRLTPARPWRGCRLDRAAVPGLPVEPVDNLDQELVGLLGTDTSGAHTPEKDASSQGPDGAVGLLDRGSTPSDPSPATPPVDSAADLHESRLSRADRPENNGPSPGGRPGRSLEELREALHAAVDAGSLDSTSAEAIRRELNCGSKSARRLRDEWRYHHEQEGGNHREH